MSDAARRDEIVLSEADDEFLRTAHRELRAAVKAYEPFLASGPHDRDALRAAQEAIEAAENRLWQLRKELLGWARPAWAPSASLTADWFSDEDAIYDDLPEATAP